MASNGVKIGAMKRVEVVVVGGGASGMVAAISAGRKGRETVICERMPSHGRKVLVSGNGRCNLSNEKLDISFYNPSSRGLVDSIFNTFGKEDIENLFGSMGLELAREDGRVFPATNQSSSVLKVLDIELRRLGVSVEHNFDVKSIGYSGGSFTVTSGSGVSISSGSVILAAGGKTYPALGSDGSAYSLAAAFGHRIVEPVPAAVPITVKDHICHALQGQRIRSDVRAVIGGSAASQASGDLLFTKYGFSGTAVLDVSDDISIAINRMGKKDVSVVVDMVPFMNEKSLSNELEKRRGRDFPAAELLSGILPNKFASPLKTLLKESPPRIASKLKNMRFPVSGTRGWNEADFTAGGVDIRDVAPGTIESKLRKGLYFAGEILDVNGKRGGYNLAWAWASGFTAGLKA